MSNWIQTYDSVFFLSVGTLIIGFLGLALKGCLRSKCESFSCLWGLFIVKRRVDLEARIEEKEIENGVNLNDIESKTDK